MNLALTLRCLVILVVPLFCGFAVVGQPLLPGIGCACGEGGVEVTWQCQYDGVKHITVNRSFDSLGRFEKVGRLDVPVKGTQRYFDRDSRAGNRYYRLSIEFNSGLVWQSNMCRIVVDTTCVLRRSASKTALVKDTAEQGGERNVVSVVSMKRIVLPRPIDNIAEPLFVIPVHVGVQKNTGHVFVKLPPDPNGARHSIYFYDLQGVAIVGIADLRADYVLIEKRNFQHRGVYKFLLKKDGSELESGYITVLPGR
ncbi:MAG: hypothetical protein JNM41_11700 [Flavipsychrobacter sp.]|nr:hypothetical protein [Flavipsychrobacter sp.]